MSGPEIALSERLGVSVVIPVFDEEENITVLVERVDDVMARHGVPWETIVVDDGSRDGTLAKLRALRGGHPRLRVVRMRRNYGQTLAMQAGIDAARGEVVVTLDGDLQNDPEDIPRLLACLDEGWDVVSGWRRKRRDNALLRTLPSRVANRIIGALSGVRLHDTGCSLKAYRREPLQRVRLYADMHRFIPALVSVSGARITELEVAHHPRRAGRSKYGLSRIYRVLLDLVIIQMITGFAARPGAWFSLMGWPWFVLSGVLLWSGLESDSIVLPASAFLAFFLGIHFLVLSFLGELALASGTYRPERIVEEDEL